MTLTEILTILAILAGPLVGIRVQTWLEAQRSKRERRERIFKTLMVTRGTALSYAHVEALNTIDIEFLGRSGADKNVRNAWKAYLDHLNNRSISDPQATPDVKNRWNERTTDLLVDLLYEMSCAVGYDFDRTYIRRAAYTPIKYGDMEFENDVIRKLLVRILAGDRAIPISIQGGQSEEQQRLNQLLIEHYENERPINVRIIENEKQANKNG